MSEGHWVNCWRCKTQYFLPTALYTAAKANEDISFHCPYGHSAHYPAGDTDEAKLRRERDRLAQQLAERDDEIRRQRGLRETTERQLSATKGVITRIKNRVGHGVCPCCNRTFSDLQRHMHSKHPAYPKSETLEAAE